MRAPQICLSIDLSARTAISLKQHVDSLYCSNKACMSIGARRLELCACQHGEASDLATGPILIQGSHI